MKVFIVYAHPDPGSFNGAMKDHAVSVLRGQDHRVRLSDLYAMGFKAVADGDDFAPRADPDLLSYPAEQRAAFEAGTTAPDIAAEQSNLDWADCVIFQFPMWWYTVPAILKGWLERVLAVGYAYGGGRIFDQGGLRGTRAMVSCTTHGFRTSYEPTGWHGDIGSVLRPLHNGLRFVGFDVLPPVVAYNVTRCSAEERERYLAEYRRTLMGLPGAVPLAFPSLDEYDEIGRLRAAVGPSIDLRTPGLEGRSRSAGTPRSGPCRPA